MKNNLNENMLFQFSCFENNLIKSPNKIHQEKNIPYETFLSSNFNNQVVKNKFCFVGYSDDYFFDLKDCLKNEYFDFYKEVAESNTGIIFTGGFYINLKKENLYEEIIFNEKSLERFKNFIKEIHSFGSKIFLQIKSGLGRGDEKNKFLNLMNYSASYNKSFNNSSLLCMRTSDGLCNRIIDEMLNFAKFANDCNFDGILIDGNLFGFVGEISSPETNRRQFGYFSEIYDFSEKLITNIININKKMNIFFSFSVESYVFDIYGKEYKNIKSIKNFKENFKKILLTDYFCKLVQYGVDGFILNLGTFETEFLSSLTEFANENVFENYYLEIDKYFKENLIKNKFGNDVIFIYKDFFNSFSEKIISKKNFYIDITNQILSDKKFLFKIKEKLPYKNCIMCGYCSNKLKKYNSISCVINPRFNINFNKSNSSKIAVIGSGVSGLNCAIFLAKRGYKVDLYERLKVLNQYGKLKELFGYNLQLKKYNEYLENEIYNYQSLGNLFVKLEHNFTLSNYDYNQYSDIVIATGSSEKFSDIPGSILKNVKNIFDVLLNKNILDDKKDIIIYAKSELSLSFAQYLLLLDKKITLLISSVDFLFKMQNSKLTYFLYSLNKLNCNIFLQSKIKKIENDFVEIYINSRFEKEKFNTLILNMKLGKKYKFIPKAKSIDLDLFIYEPETYANNRLYYELVNSKYNGKIFMIGNALYPCDIAESIKTAFFVAKNI